MSQPTEAAVIAALKAVAVPPSSPEGRTSDVIALNMVSGITIKDGRVVFTLEVAPDRTAGAESLRQAAEQAVAAVPGVRSVGVVLTAHRARGADTSAPAHAHAHAGGGHAHGAHRHAPAVPAPRPRPLPGVRTIVAVASGKGGVGKSTTAVNLALGLQALGLKVGILDADIYGPSLPRLLAITERPTSPDGQTLRPIDRLGLKTMSIGFMVAEDTPTIWRGPIVQGALQQMLWQVSWAPLDVLVVDLPPGTGDVQLTMAQQVPLTGAVIVSTPQDLALIDARKGFAMFRKVDVPVLGIIENMSTFQCPHCGQTTDIFGHGGARHDAARLGVPFLGEIPLAPILRETSDHGTPIVHHQPDSPHAVAYRAIAATVWELIGPGE